MYGSTGVIAEILLHSYITLMCTVFILYMSRDYHIYYIFVLYVDAYILIFVFYHMCN